MSDLDSLKRRYAQLENRVAYRWSSLDAAELRAIRSTLLSLGQIA